MKKPAGSKYLINSPIYDTAKGRPQLLRIVISPEYTKVDFGFQNDKSGWVRIDAKTFIRIKDTGQKLTMVRAENIPLAPVHHTFNTTKDWLYFSLYFPPLQIKEGKIDVIEAEPGSKKDFNYYNIVLDSKKFIELL